MFKDDYIPSIEEGSTEFNECYCHVLYKLFKKQGILPFDIDILIVNISCFSPSPSLATSIIHHYKMGENIKVYNLIGMGCNATLIAIDMTKDFLRVCENSLAMIVSSNNISQSWYAKNEKSVMVTNCLFRAGGVAIQLTNKKIYKRSAKLKLLCMIETHIGLNP